MSKKSFLISLLMISLTSSIFALELKLATYNLGLAEGYVPYAKERRSHLSDALKQSSADVLCLQEVWLKKDRKQILKKLKKAYPYSLYTPIKNIKSESAPTCSYKDLFGKGKFVSCIQKQCKGKEGSEHSDCILDKCDGALQSLKQKNRECATSLMAQVGKSTIAGLLTVMNPFSAAGLFAYKGSDGLLLLSKYPLKDKRYLNWSSISTLNRRNAIIAEVETKAGRNLTVACTHLASDLQDVPYTGAGQSWASDHQAQMNELVRYINSLGTTVASVLMGDFNCGPSLPMMGIYGELESTCNIPLQNNFSRSFIGGSEASCTYCSSNILNKDDTEDILIDHVFTKNLSIKKEQVIFNQSINIETKDGLKKMHLSDHFGVQVSVDL